MFRRYSKLFHLLLLSLDILILSLSLSIAILLRFNSFNVFAEVTSNESYIFILIFNALWIILAEGGKIYDNKAAESIKTINKILTVLVRHFLLIALILVIFKFQDFSRLVLFYTYSIFLVGIVTAHLSFIKIIRKIPGLGLHACHVVIAGAGVVGQELIDFFRSGHAPGFKIVGIFDDYPEKSKCVNEIVGPLSHIPEFSLKNRIDEIYTALPDKAAEKVNQLMEFSEEKLIRLKIVPDFRRYIKHNLTVDFYGNIPIFLVRDEPLERMTNRFIKRTFDIVFSIVFLATLFPLIYIVIGLLIKVSSPGPVFYKQERWGKMNHRFLAIKFRSMKYNVKSVDDKGNLIQATKNDPRITKIGKFIRRYNFDEMPQFFNVLLGDMSVIGPRPHPSPLNKKYIGRFSKYNARHLVKPGISGWAQVHGLRGETNDPEKMKRRVDLDLWYIENWSFALDMAIIYKTIYNMIAGDENAV